MKLGDTKTTCPTKISIAKTHTMAITKVKAALALSRLCNGNIEFVPTTNKNSAHVLINAHDAFMSGWEEWEKV